MSLEDTQRDELVARLRVLLDAAGEDKREHDRILHDLQVYQIELELQNRELREAQSALEASRNRYADLYDFAPIAYFTFDPVGRVLEVNLTGATLIGREREQLIGAPFTALVDLADHTVFRTHLRRCADARVPVVTELALTTRRGVALQLRAVSSPVADPAGKSVAFRTAFIDVTDRHLAELSRNAALDSERILRLELESLDHAKTVLAGALATTTAHSVTALLQVVVEQARTIADAEYAALGIGEGPEGAFATWVHTGMTPDQVAAIGRSPRRVGTLGAVIDAAQPVRVKGLASHPAFAGFPAHHPAMTSFLGVPVRFADRVIGNLYLTNKRSASEFSVDDQRAIESMGRYVGAVMEIARLGDAAQDAIRSRELLLETVSHDLRGPLSAISVSSSLLRRLLMSTDEHLARKQAETIQRAADRMTRIIDDLLTASTIEAGRLAVSARAERIEPIVAEAVELYAQVAAESSLQLDTHVPSGLPDVLCDRERVHQVLSNLVGNAAKFTPPGGRITIELARLDDHVEVSVVDTGPGIAADAVPHIFDRYWKGAVGMRGVGLGLYICRGIVESLGGRIWVDGTPGDGARFTFTLPVAKATGT